MRPSACTTVLARRVTRALALGVAVAACAMLVAPATALAYKQSYSFVTSWPFPTPLPSSSFAAHGMAIGTNGDLLVSSHDTYVADYTTAGSFQGQIGAGTLSQVDSVAERGSDLWLLDAVEGVAKFDTDGDYLGTSVTGVPGSGVFNEADGIALDASGAVYVSDRSSSTGYGYRVSKFTSSGVYVTDFGSGGTNGAKFMQSASSIAVGPRFDVYVADWLANKVWHYAPTNAARTAYTLVGSWSDDARFPNPHGVAVDVAGNIFVLDDYGTGQLSKLDPSGEVLAHSDRGSGFAYLWSVAVNGAGHVFVDDRDNAMIEEFYLANMRPTTNASANLTVKKGKSVSFKYKAGDDVNPNISVTIKVYKGSSLKATIKCGSVSQGLWHTKSWTCKLAKGKYTWKVYATDTAAQTQRNIAYKTLTVK